VKNTQRESRNSLFMHNKKSFYKITTVSPLFFLLYLDFLFPLPFNSVYIGNPSERQLKVQLRWDTLSATISGLYRGLLCLPCSTYLLYTSLFVTWPLPDLTGLWPVDFSAELSFGRFFTSDEKITSVKFFS